MTTRHFFILEEADQEIDEQVAYYAEKAGAALAERFYAMLKSSLAALAESPGRGRLFGSNHPALSGIRACLVPGFPVLIYYRAVEGGIEVVHVLHGARDRDSILEGE